MGFDLADLADYPPDVAALLNGGRFVTSSQEIDDFVPDVPDPIRKTFDESKHERDHGKFASKGGGSAGDGKPSKAVSASPMSKAVSSVIGSHVSDDAARGIAGAASSDNVSFDQDDDGRVQISVDNDEAMWRVRVVSGEEIHLDSIMIQPQAQGEGRGTKIFKQMVDSAAAQGVKRITMDAAGSAGEEENGYYTWARLGGDAALPRPMKSKIKRAGLGNIEYLSDLMLTPEGRSWWKANGQRINLTFELNDGSTSRRVLDEYVAAKSALKKSLSLPDGIDEELLDEIWARIAAERDGQSVPVLKTFDESKVNRDKGKFAPKGGGSSSLGKSDDDDEVISGKPKPASMKPLEPMTLDAKKEMEKPAMGKVWEKIRANPEVAALMDRANGDENNYTIGSHTRAVLSQLPKQIKKEEAIAIDKRWGGNLANVLEATIALHDIGKPLAIDKKNRHAQHEFTKPILTAEMKKHGFSDREIALADSLVDNDYLGKVQQMVVSPRRAAFGLVAQADKAGMDPNDFFKLQEAFFHADAGSYNFVRGYMREEEGGRLKFKDPKTDEVGKLVAELAAKSPEDRKKSADEYHAEREKRRAERMAKEKLNPPSQGNLFSRHSSGEPTYFGKPIIRKEP